MKSEFVFLSYAFVQTALAATPQIIPNGNFVNGTTGWVSSPAATVAKGEICLSVPAGGSYNSSYLRTNATFLETKNDVYTLNFTARASAGLNVGVQTPDPPLDPNLDVTASLTTTNYPLSFTFSPANQAPAAWLQFNFGNISTAATICISNITMHRIDRSGFVQDVGLPIKVNQVGYVLNGPKVATVVTGLSSSESWQLLNANGVVVAQGSTTPRGNDTSSSQNVATVDFSSYSIAGDGYTLKTASGATSYPFSISRTLYNDLRQDAMMFFYQQRSGIAIDGNLVGSQYARAAGHVGVPPNKGDTAVPCQTTTDALIAYLEPWTCNYTLDVTQGWYDAGDQGKYVVNGGIATAQLFGAYERSLYARNASSAPLGDGSLRIPERSNGIPDWLDEARWELDFMMKMQVPAGSPPQLVNGSYIDLSGMVHHKMHDNQWTSLPTDPSQDPKRRELHRPSTAGTLNMVATAAQGSRLFKPFDPVYSQKCLAAARVAYAAAKKNPAILAPGTDWDLGGGAYSDNDVRDEFYWAAAEMYVTTGEQAFAADLASSYYNTANSLYKTASTNQTFSAGGFGWGSVAALGRLTLATVPNNATNRAQIIASVIAGADQYVAFQQAQAYGIMTTQFPWGSNSNFLNIVQVVATAYDLTGNATYRTAALQGIDYILGRNALGHSYVTGYGTKFSDNEHSRLYAAELDARVPHPPHGAMAGGANSAPNDPPANDVLKGCKPQMCYVDDVNSYSTNEVAVNWNSALAWVAAWAASQ